MENEATGTAEGRMAARGQRVGEKLDELAGGAQDLLERGKGRAVAWREGATQYIQDQPMKAALIAAGIGLVFGVLLARR